MESEQNPYELNRANQKLEDYVRLEEEMTQELLEKKKQKLKLEKIKRIQKQKDRQKRANFLKEEQKKLKYLITASEIKWGDYKNLDACTKMDEKLGDYRETCEDILEKRDHIIQFLQDTLGTTEEDFISTLSKHQKGRTLTERNGRVCQDE
jgi:hypothetical protein